MAIPSDMAAECLNIELREGGLGKKRSGSVAQALTGTAFTGYRALAKFTPGNIETDAEMHICSGDGTPKILRVTAAVAAGLTLKDNVASSPQSWNAAALNNKLFQAYDSTVNRLQVYAPNESTSNVRRAGLAPTGVITASNTGAGTYPAIERFYRVRVLAKVGSVVVRTSNPGTSNGFTPSGAGTAARVAQPASMPNEGETHWIVEASIDDVTFWQMSGELTIATTTWDDSTVPNDYEITGDVPPPDGSCYPFPSCKYILSDGTRLFGLGAWETSAGTSVTPVSGRLYFTPRLGTSDLGDDERLESTTTADGWIDLALGAGGDDRGLGGPLNNAIYAFQSNATYMFVPTGNANTPYRRVVLSQRIGAVSHQSIVQAEDENGQPCLYFLNPSDGPYRIGTGYTMQWLGKDVKDLWDTINLSATGQTAWGIYDRSRKLIIWGIATGSSNTPDKLIVFDVTNGKVSDGDSIRKGWVQWTGDIATSYCALVFNSTLATTRPLTTTPYYGSATGTTLLRTSTSATQDGSTNYQAYVRSRAFRWAPLGRFKKILDAVLIAKAQTATTIRQRLIADWGFATLDRDVSIAPVGSETYVRPRPDAVDFTDLRTLQVEIGDSAAANTTWELESWEGAIELLKDAR
ncbi:hypothetical protein UFOVP509_49 [uncultured Caudovirales phage]|uniref:Uncharacterized protein n=1 Tax=uncultured Caudovirales phage TaxID=2100421 RepID=A0A6J5MN66_9CAUD|nr:hypothetical protein UFOVP509_49 [uncultured Caudovirales phage]